MLGQVMPCLGHSIPVVRTLLPNFQGSSRADIHCVPQCDTHMYPTVDLSTSPSPKYKFGYVGRTTQSQRRALPNEKAQPKPCLATTGFDPKLAGRSNRGVLVRSEAQQRGNAADAIELLIIGDIDELHPRPDSMPHDGVTDVL